MSELEPLVRLVVTIGAPLDVGRLPGGYRRVIPITGGTFEGDRLRGEVVPGGADWNTVRPDGTMHFWARYTLRTDDGMLIGVVNEALLPDAVEAIAAHTAGSAGWVARCRPRFEAPEGRYQWLNATVCIGEVGPGPEPGSVAVTCSTVG